MRSAIFCGIGQRGRACWRFVSLSPSSAVCQGWLHFRLLLLLLLVFVFNLRSQFPAHGTTTVPFSARNRLIRVFYVYCLFYLCLSLSIYCYIY